MAHRTNYVALLRHAGSRTKFCQPTSKTFQQLSSGFSREVTFLARFFNLIGPSSIGGQLKRKLLLSGGGSKVGRSGRSCAVSYFRPHTPVTGCVLSPMVTPKHN